MKYNTDTLSGCINCILNNNIEKCAIINPDKMIFILVQNRYLKFTNSELYAFSKLSKTSNKFKIVPLYSIESLLNDFYSDESKTIYIKKFLEEIQ